VRENGKNESYCLQCGLKAIQGESQEGSRKQERPGRGGRRARMGRRNRRKRRRRREGMRKRWRRRRTKKTPAPLQSMTMIFNASNDKL